MLLPLYPSLPFFQINGKWGTARKSSLCTSLCTLCSNHTFFLAFPWIQEALSYPELLASTFPSATNALPSNFAQNLRLLQVSTQKSLLPGGTSLHLCPSQLWWFPSWHSPIFVMTYFSFLLHILPSHLSMSPLGNRLVCFIHQCRLL